MSKLSAEFIEEQKAKLLTEKNTVESELRFVGEQSKKGGDFKAKFPNMGDDEDSNAAEVYTFAQNLAVEQDLEIILDKIKAALAGIKNGTYGKCDKGDDIEPERLKVLPWAGTCIKHSR